MSKLQNNYTTQEQSKRLLELGVPAGSADLFYDNDWLKMYEDDVPLVIYNTNNFTEYDQQEYTPCWSVGRLMEIYKIVGEEAGQCISCSKNQTQVESLVQLYEENIELLDFSKLEE